MKQDDELATDWKYTDASRTVVRRTYPNGMQESMLVGRQEVVSWVISGNTILPED